MDGCKVCGYPAYRNQLCPVCNDDRDDDEPDQCPKCGGTGRAADNGTNFGECEDCYGTGDAK